MSDITIIEIADMLSKDKANDVLQLALAICFMGTAIKRHLDADARGAFCAELTELAARNDDHELLQLMLRTIATS